MDHSSSAETKLKADTFRALHVRNTLFVMPCAWDTFSAMLFERAGFPCIGTTSGGVNWVNGRKDYIYSTPKAEMLGAYGEIARSTKLPTSGDLENGYGIEPEDVTDTILRSIAEGMVGGSIEDTGTVPTDDEFTNGELIELQPAVERIQAARTAADSSGIQYTLTARCEVYYTSHEHPFDESVTRLNAYREAGADCLFVPGLNDLTLLEQLVKEVDGPISFGMGATPKPISVSMLEDVGVRRISTGGGLTRATFGLIEEALSELKSEGTFGYLDGALSETAVNQILGTGT